MYKRTVTNTLDRYSKSTCFLFGPRQTGKTTILLQRKDAIYIDLLSSHELLKYSANPDALWRELSIPKENSKYEVIIDEVQKLPSLLDVVQRCIDQLPQYRFILSGSSARKLKRGSTNLLGGRAIGLRLSSLSYEELEHDYDLELVLRYGSLPKIISLVVQKQEELAAELLKSYVRDYLLEEIKAEAIVRQLDSFQRFLTMAAAQFAEEVNFAGMASDCSVSQYLVRNYYTILEDTLLGFFIPPYARSQRKVLTKKQKFYFFDNGITRTINGLTISAISPAERGRLFEQHIIQEILKINEYYRKDFRFYYWRTKAGAEVDLLIEQGRKLMLAIEFKSKSTTSGSDLVGLKSFKSEFKDIPCILCAPVDKPQLLNDQIELLPPLSLFERIKAL